MHSDMNLKQLVSQHADYYAKDLAELCGDIQSEQTAETWFRMKIGLMSGMPDRASGYFHQIPAEWRNLEICLAYVGNSPQKLGDIDPGMERYSSVVAHALSRDSSVLQLVHPSHQTEHLARFLINNHPHAFIDGAQSCTWARDRLTPPLIETACKRSPSIAMKVGRDLLSAQALSFVVEFGINQYHEFREQKRLELLIEPLKQGQWPRGNRVTANFPRPTGLSSAARFLLETHDDDAQALYMAYLMNHPIEKVAKVLGGSRGSKFLLEMYTDAQLHGHMTDMSRLVRGKLLESDLGM